MTIWIAVHPSESHPLTDDDRRIQPARPVIATRTNLYFNPLSYRDDGVVPPLLASAEICHRRKP
jgi:hypothetical protein